MNPKQFCFALLAALPLIVQAQNPAPVTAGNPGAAPVAAAEITLVTGRVTVSAATGARSLGAGDKVFAGDTLLVGPNSYANLKFPDGGRVLLRPNTDFTVEAYQYAPLAETPAGAAPAAGKGKVAAPAQQAFFRLLRGGFRAVSGLIGKADQQAYRVTTPVATIGIRGTDYEVQICSDDCPETPPSAGLGGVEVATTALAGLELAQAAPGGNSAGVVVATNDGTVALQTGRGEFLVKVGEVAFALANGQVFMLPVVPDVLLRHPTPSPEDCN